MPNKTLNTHVPEVLLRHEQLGQTAVDVLTGQQEAELAAQVNLYTNNLMQFSQIEDKNCILQEGRTVDPIEPHWFKLVPDPYNGNKMIHEYD